MNDIEKNDIDITSVKALKFFYSQNALTDFLQTLSDEELNKAQVNIEVTDIDDFNARLLDAIYQEKEYRQDARFIDDSSAKKGK